MSGRGRGRVRRAGYLLAACLLVGSLGLVASSCVQRESHTEYESHLETTQPQVKDLIAKLQNASISDTSYYSNAETTMRTDADDFDAISPPSDVQAGHDAYRHALRGLAKLMATLADCARLAQGHAGSASACRAKVSSGQLDDIQNDLNEASTIFQDHGYKNPS
jgi:hypothetical protein